MIWFFKLIRPINLLIIGITMYSMRYFYIDLAQLQFKSGFSFWTERLDFFLLVFSTVLIAAAGNIINDYFDVRADRINRPDRLIITQHVKKRWAIILHWSLNGLAFAMGAYLSIRYQTFWYVFIHLLSINTLWFYSTFFKRKLLLGNVIIAALTALVPLLCGIHFYLVGELQESLFRVEAPQIPEYFKDWIWYMAEHGRFIYAMLLFAFVLNLSREMIKDIQDVEGDKVLRAKTLPIRFGVKSTAVISAIILLLVPISGAVLYLNVKTYQSTDLFFFLPVLFAFFIALILAFFMMMRPELHFLKLYDRALKIAMFFGLILPWYWYFLF